MIDPARLESQAREALQRVEGREVECPHVEYETVPDLPMPEGHYQHDRCKKCGAIRHYSDYGQGPPLNWEDTGTIADPIAEAVRLAVSVVCPCGSMEPGPWASRHWCEACMNYSVIHDLDDDDLTHSEQCRCHGTGRVPRQFDVDDPADMWAWIGRLMMVEYRMAWTFNGPEQAPKAFYRFCNALEGVGQLHEAMDALNECLAQREVAG